MSDSESRPGPWARLPVALRAVISGLAVGLIAANVWSVLLLTVGGVAAPVIEAGFLVAYVWWAGGRGPPRSTVPARCRAFRATTLSPAAWLYGLIAAVAFAASVHAAIVILFRLVPFPAADFHKGYDLSAMGAPWLQWVIVVVSATSAGVCEETGFRGYMQQPLEARYGPKAAILVSAIFFTLLHLNKGWATIGMVPIVLGAGGLLGAMAWASRSLIPCIIGHTLMDIGLFAYWWTQIAGTFTGRPIGQTGIDAPFLAAAAIFAVSLALCLTCIWRLRRVTT